MAWLQLHNVASTMPLNVGVCDATSNCVESEMEQKQLEKKKKIEKLYKAII